MTHDTGLGSKPDKKAIADAIQRYLDANGLARKDLIREHLSKSTIEKLFQGDFSDRTLNKIEGVLKTSFQRPVARRQEAASRTVGAYVFDAVEYLQGDYLCVRPLFTNPSNFSAYLIQIVWSAEQNCLVFEEASRFDAKYRQIGTVYIPFGTSFMNLVSSAQGNVRTILLSLPDSEGALRGIISTLSNPKGSIFIPVTAPIFLRKLRAGEQPELGKITPENASYEDYRSLLMTVLSEEFGIFAVPPASVPAQPKPRVATKP